MAILALTSYSKKPAVPLAGDMAANTYGFAPAQQLISAVVPDNATSFVVPCDLTKVNGVVLTAKDAEADTMLTAGQYFKYPFPESGTIATGATTTVLALAAGPEVVNDVYNGCKIIIKYAATGDKAIGTIKDYVGATRTVTLQDALPVAPAESDQYWIVGVEVLGVADPGGAAEVDVLVFGELD